MNLPEFTDASLADPSSATETGLGATAATTVTRADTVVGDSNTHGCPKCGAPQPADSQVAICRACGWYEGLGTYVEMDSWEVEQAAGGEATQAEPINHMDVWLNLLPKWAWVLIGIQFTILLESLAARLLFGEEIRMVWSVTQLACGFLVFTVCHIVTYMKAIFQDSAYGLLDVLIKPVKIWQPTWRALPGTLPLIGGGTGGLMAAACSLLVIGALPYDRLWDWGIEAPPKTSLMQAIANQGLPGGGEEKDLDESVKEFAATAAVKPGGPDAFQKTNKKPVAREYVDCVIIGFTTLKSEPEYINSIIVAHDVEGRLVLGGRIRPWFDREYSAKFIKKLEQIERRYPFVDNSYEARWVEPEIICRITCKRINNKGRLVEAKFEELRTKLKFD